MVMMQQPMQPGMQPMQPMQVLMQSRPGPMQPSANHSVAQSMGGGKLLPHRLSTPSNWPFPIKLQDERDERSNPGKFGAHCRGPFNSFGLQAGSSATFCCVTALLSIFQSLTPPLGHIPMANLHPMPFPCLDMHQTHQSLSLNSNAHLICCSYHMQEDLFCCKRIYVFMRHFPPHPTSPPPTPPHPVPPPPSIPPLPPPFTCRPSSTARAVTGRS